MYYMDLHPEFEDPRISFFSNPLIGKTFQKAQESKKLHPKKTELKRLFFIFLQWRKITAKPWSSSL